MYSVALSGPNNYARAFVGIYAKLMTEACRGYYLCKLASMDPDVSFPWGGFPCDYLAVNMSATCASYRQPRPTYYPGTHGQLRKPLRTTFLRYLHAPVDRFGRKL